MTALIPAGTVLLLMAACIGAGGLILNVLGIIRELPRFERVIWSFPVGFAALGWILFFPAFAGLLSASTVFIAVVVLAMMGFTFFLIKKTNATIDIAPWAPAGAAAPLTKFLLLASIGVVLGVDILEGIAPPAEADTLAYHFNLPKRYLETGGLLFIPRAVDGAPPQLVHMTYMAALALGGERALTAWTMVSGWMTGGLLFALSRRWLPLTWALALTLIYLSTPAVLQTGGAGTMEPRIAQFVLLGAIACGLAVSKDAPRYAALAGICAGTFAASKYTGLLFGAACLLALLVSAGRWRQISAFAALGALVAFQWYFWNWLQTGDPMFPMLYRFIGTTDPNLWTDAQDVLFQRWRTSGDIALPATLWSFFAYPFYATFIYHPALENARTGLGIFIFFTLPFATAFLFGVSKQTLRSPLFVAAAITLLFFVFWFFGGLPQRVRHLLPLYPLVLLILTVASVRWASETTGAPAPLVTGAVLAIVWQLGGQTLFGLNYARYVFTGEDREAFLRRNISHYELVPWINNHLSATDRVLTFERQLLYLFDHRPILSASNFQARLNFSTQADRPDQLFEEMRRAGITHVMDTGEFSRESQTPVPRRQALRSMIAGHCLSEVHRANVRWLQSRTLSWSVTPERPMFLFALTPKTCRLLPGGS
jgi:hypothetical protein